MPGWQSFGPMGIVRDQDLPDHGGPEIGTAAWSMDGEEFS